MNRPGVSVTARRGYFGAVDGRPSPDALAIAEARKPVDEALSQLTRSDRLTDVAAYGVAVNEGLFLVMELIGQDARDAWRAGGEIVAVVTDNGGREWRGVGRLDVGASSAAVSVALDTTRGPWRVTLGLEGHDDVDLGAVFTVEAACCLPMVFRGAASSQAPVRPTAVFTFRRTERLRLEWPGSDAAGGFAARLLDRQGRPLIEALPMRDGGAVDAAMVVTDIPLGSLAAGDYVVEATDIAQLHAPRRLFAFRVLR
jgi:hypothetical protein